jgi:hypothetical protein
MARAEFPGFFPGVLKEVRVRQGDNRHIIVLRVENFQETVNVAQDAQAGAADRRSDAFGSVLTREQMDALSDDPDEMPRQLMEMAGPGAVLRIDSFEGGRLPPKSQIKSIRVTRDQFAAENHSADSFFVEVITQPGIGPVRTGFNYGLRNSAMSARNAFHQTKGEEQDQFYGLNIGGGVIQNRASFFLRVNGNSAYDTPNSSIARTTGTTIETLKQRVPRENMFVNASFDWAATRDQTLRFSYNRNAFVNKNQGIGRYDEPERAFLSRNYNNTFRAQEVGPLGRLSTTPKCKRRCTCRTISAQAEPVGNSGRPPRKTDAHARRDGGSADGCDVGSVQEWQDDAAGELGHFLRLAAHLHLRADDSDRWVPAERDQYREPDLPDPAGSRQHDAYEPAVLVRGIQTGDQEFKRSRDQKIAS